jgi:hypothetical protein
MISVNYGEHIEGVSIGKQPIRAGVFNEYPVRAAAGLTLVFGAVAFVYAYFAKEYATIQLVTTLFFVEFLMRVALGLKFSPFGQLARLLTWREAPQWVSAKPKRFAWSLGLGCEIYGAMARRGWLATDEAYEICSSGACAVERPETRS